MTCGEPRAVAPDLLLKVSWHCRCGTSTTGCAT